jgi:hypothetical protein
MVQRLVDASLVRTRLGAATVLAAAILGSAWGATVNLGGEGTAGATPPDGVTPLSSATQAAVSVPRARVTAPEVAGTDGAEPATQPVVVLNPVPPAETRTRTVVVTVTMTPAAPTTTTTTTSAAPPQTTAPAPSETTEPPAEPTETATKPGGKAVDGGSAEAGGKGGGDRGGEGG